MFFIDDQLWEVTMHLEARRLPATAMLSQLSWLRLRAPRIRPCVLEFGVWWSWSIWRKDRATVPSFRRSISMIAMLPANRAEGSIDWQTRMPNYHRSRENSIEVASIHHLLFPFVTRGSSTASSYKQITSTFPARGSGDITNDEQLSRPIIVGFMNDAMRIRTDLSFERRHWQHWYDHEYG